MNECDFMKSQIQIYQELAEGLLNGEIQIKRQRADFFHKRGNPNSMEAKKINFAQYEAVTKIGAEKEIRLKAAHSLQLALKAQDQLKKMELDRQKNKNEEYFYYEQLIKQKPVEARENLVDKIKHLMKFFEELLGKLKLFIQQLKQQIDHLKALKKSIINNKVVPLVNQIRNHLIKEIKYSVNGIPVDLKSPINNLLDKFIDHVHKGTISMENLKEKWLGGPYVEGEIHTSLHNTSLSPNDKKIVKEEIWSALQKYSPFEALKRTIREEVAEVENMLKPLEQMKETAEKLMGKAEDCSKEIIDVVRSSVQKVEDYADLSHSAREMPKALKQVEHFIEKGIGELTHIQKKTSVQEEKASEKPSSSSDDDYEEPPPVFHP